jgi:hypothetical protein
MLHASAAFPSHWVLVLEAALVVAGLGLAAIGFPPLAAAGRVARRTLRRVARRPALSISAIALASALYLALHAAVSGAPVPRVVDEWSYLLAADTFAHNRLANPPHPMAAHFDGDHVLQRPTYASKYPPAQGFVLAIGQVALGHPAAGLWLQAALLVAALGWMLRAWVPPQWAVFGALLAALRVGAGGYWNESYWGGSVAAIGGALVLGAARRIWRQVRVLDSILLGVGLLVLATSRPFEGAVAALPVASMLAGGLVLRRLGPAPWTRLVLPVGLLLVATAAGLATVNRAVTGDPLEFPHQLYDRTHGVPPVFLWQPLENAGDAGGSTSTGWRSPRTSGWHRLAVDLYFFLGLAGSLALVTAPASLQKPWPRVAALVFVAVAAAHFLVYPWWVHYSAPALAALLVLAVEGHRRLCVARSARIHRGRAFGRGLFATACAAQLAVFLAQVPSQRPDATDPCRQRARLAWDFEHRPGTHLLLVTYPPGWSGDWTYNPADIDRSKVVWATDLGAERNADLLRYFADRTVWSVDAAFTDRDPVPRLVRPARAEVPAGR